jgi:hypothetical protein
MSSSGAIRQDLAALPDMVDRKNAAGQIKTIQIPVGDLEKYCLFPGFAGTALGRESGNTVIMSY